MDLSVSPDGRWIAFTANFNDKWDICMMEARGGACRRLLKSPENEYNPSWFPDGKRVCAARTTGGTMKLVILSREGGAEEIIDLGVSLPAAFPEVSPDGKRIAFVGSDAAGHPQTYDLYLWEMEDPAAPGKGTLKRLTQNEVMDTDPSFSPDGKRILYTCNAEGNDDIWMVNADGTDARCVLARPGQDLAPVFSPDGKKAAFAAFSDPNKGGADAEIWTLDLTTKTVEQLTSNDKKDLKPRWR